MGGHVLGPIKLRDRCGTWRWRRYGGDVFVAAGQPFPYALNRREELSQYLLSKPAASKKEKRPAFPLHHAITTLQYILLLYNTQQRVHTHTHTHNLSIHESVQREEKKVEGEDIKPPAS